ncbi:alpha-1D adrenergic receptor-like isoform X2 [Symsagittifera roscoffensis]
MLLLAVVGSLFNICVLVVYAGKRNKCTFEVFVFFLAAVNLSGSLVAMPVETVVVWADSREACNSPPDYTLVVTMVLECASILSLLNIAVDRYFSICWPTHSVITESRAQQLCAVVVAVALLLAVIPFCLSESIMEIHLIYSVAAAIVLLCISLLYVMVFLKVRATASRFRRNRFQAAQRSLTIKDNSKDSQIASTSVYTVAADLKKGSTSQSLLTVESIQFAERRSSGAPRTQSISISQIHEHQPTSDGVSNSALQSSAIDCLIELDQTEQPGTSRPHEVVRAVGSLSSDLITLADENPKKDTRSRALPPLPPNSSRMSMARANRARFQCHRQSSEKGLHEAMQSRTAKILTIITLCYALCFLPSSVINFIFYIHPNIFLANPPTVTWLVKHLQLLYNLNFVLSPSVYSLFSESFRKDGVALTNRLRRKLTI